MLFPIATPIFFSPKSKAMTFVLGRLFDEGAIKRFKKRSSFTQFDSILIDPPRKGFPALADWIKACKPKQLIYVSCNAATMARDLQALEGKFTIDKMILVDLFPSTYHFETVACLSFK